MLLTLTTNFQPDYDADDADDADCTEVLACTADGQAVMRVKIDFTETHSISYELLAADLTHQSIARVILAASNLIDSFFIDADSVWGVEV